MFNHLTHTRKYNYFVCTLFRKTSISDFVVKSCFQITLYFWIQHIIFAQGNFFKDAELQNTNTSQMFT